MLTNVTSGGEEHVAMIIFRSFPHLKLKVKGLGFGTFQLGSYMFNVIKGLVAHICLLLLLPLIDLCSSLPAPAVSLA